MGFLLSKRPTNIGFGELQHDYFMQECHYRRRNNHPVFMQTTHESLKTLHSFFSKNPTSVLSSILLNKVTVCFHRSDVRGPSSVYPSEPHTASHREERVLVRNLQKRAHNLQIVPLESALRHRHRLHELQNAHTLLLTPRPHSHHRPDRSEVARHDQRVEARGQHVL